MRSRESVSPKYLSSVINLDLNKNMKTIDSQKVTLKQVKNVYNNMMKANPRYSNKEGIKSQKVIYNSIRNVLKNSRAESS